MKREEAVAIVSDIRSGYNCFDADEEQKYHALSMAIEALEENESLAKSVNDAAELIRKLQKKNGWIPCSERLPSAEHNFEGFLTTVKCYVENDVFIHVYENGKFGHWDGEKLIPNDNVIAWMECPEPYTEEEQ